MQVTTDFGDHGDRSLEPGQGGPASHRPQSSLGIEAGARQYTSSPFSLRAVRLGASLKSYKKQRLLQLQHLRGWDDWLACSETMGSLRVAHICQNWISFRDTVYPAKSSPGCRVNFEGNGFCPGVRVASVFFSVSSRPSELYLTGSGRNMVIRHGFTQTVFLWTTEPPQPEGEAACEGLSGLFITNLLSPFPERPWASQGPSGRKKGQQMDPRSSLCPVHSLCT